MKNYIIFLAFCVFVLKVEAQVTIDLSVNNGNSQTIKITEKNIRLINCSKKFQYKIDWEFKQERTPVFRFEGGEEAGSSCNNEIKVIIGKLKTSESEDSIKKYVDLGNKLMPNIEDMGCVKELKDAISETEHIVAIPYAPLNYNQIIKVIISKVDTAGKPSKDKWTFVLKTEEKTRWLVHYGLTYTPSIISKLDHFHAFADTAVASRYTITKDNTNGPKPWDNISATINFTYPFNPDSRGPVVGFTAGFGISAGIELAGHTGFSLIIGENVIVGTGVAVMQKYKLLGKYKEGQIIKENLSFIDIHEKVWLPEIFFTLGFRFGSNPFAKITADTPASTTPAKAADTNE